MELLYKLFSYAWFQGFIMLFLLRIVTFILRRRYKDKLANKDIIVEIFVLIIFLGIPFISEFVLGINNVFKYTIIFAIIGMGCEFLFDLIWYVLTGSRLYRYFKANLLGFTSWFIFPYWAAAGLYFYGSWQFLTLLFPAMALPTVDILPLLKDLSFISLLTALIILFIFGFVQYIRGRSIKTNGFQDYKYTIIVLMIWVPILYFIYTFNNPFLAIYFIFTSITGIVLEGKLSMKLRNLYGESFWLYYRKNIFKQGTSLLILPIWGAAALLALLLFNIFLT